MNRPLPNRLPTVSLEYAREDHERCLSLAAWYRLRNARGEPGNLERHAWVLWHARTLRSRFPGQLSRASPS